MPLRIRVKICGITNLDDALLAASLGADALGFIFVPHSPRYLTPETARAIISHLPPFVTPVAVLVDESLAQANEIMTVSGCRVAQLHGGESPEYLARFTWSAYKGIAIATSSDLQAIAPYSNAQAVLLDTKVNGQLGGTGLSFDWQLARAARQFGCPIILAGGLSPENVVEALTIAQPDAIDVGSRVECEPGRKDPERLKRLFTVLHDYTCS